ncbi:MAG: hypothetical protein HYY06_01300 [Deltaproteobacteria bacterium]|nr:hypothetical protein [Deltaproteobacteria bacterium]
MTRKNRFSWTTVTILTLGCGGDKLAGTGDTEPDPSADCLDEDGDGFGRGAGCVGSDCDEMDPSRHDGCLADCAACRESCVGLDGCEPFDLENGGQNVEELPGGGVGLGPGTTPQTTLELIWIADTAQGAVSKVDTRSHVELGRYYTGTDHALDQPSRTSVDFDGDVVIANRAFGGQASVTKLLASGCPDRDGDGVVETSTGRADVLFWDPGAGPTDECVAWHTEVGCPDGQWGDRDEEREDGREGAACGVARSLAVQDRNGLDGVREEVVWVGLFNEHKYVELDRTTGAPTGVEVDVAPCSPYGAAIDRDGRLWSACLSSYLASFDTSGPGAGADVIEQPGSNYGITVDEHGHVWTGGQVTRYDPATGEFLSPGAGGQVGEGCADENGQCFEAAVWGSSVAADGNGSVWVGGCGGGVCRVREDGDGLTWTTLPVQNGAYGMAVAFDGMIWGIGMSGNNAAIIDPDTESFEIVLNDCEGGGGRGGEQGPEGDWEGQGGTGCLAFPYTYSDMTGFQLRNASAPRGIITHLFSGCESGPTRWMALGYEASVPPGSGIALEARAADDAQALGSAATIDLGSLQDGQSSIELDGLNGRLLEVRATLSSDTEAGPILFGLTVGWQCEEEFG